MRSLSLTLALSVVACAGDDTSSTSATTTTTSASSSSASTTDATGATESTGSTEATTSSTGDGSTDPFDFPPVECGDITCEEGQLCLQPGVKCNTNTEPPEWYTPPPSCVAVPPACADATAQTAAGCLGDELCTESSDIGGPASYEAGKVGCGPVELDCF
ncbi:MAG: hypothetical protein KC486_08915 [Myxococcales bacterium]|nr:hypothetical protein [Myxococcales bacterium]